jgi:excisionase family DNA binding protein
MDTLLAIENWPERFMTVEQLAEILVVSTKTVYRYIRAKKLRSIKIGNSHRLNPQTVADWLKSLES